MAWTNEKPWPQPYARTEKAWKAHRRAMNAAHRLGTREAWDAAGAAWANYKATLAEDSRAYKARLAERRAQLAETA